MSRRAAITCTAVVLATTCARAEPQTPTDSAPDTLAIDIEWDRAGSSATAQGWTVGACPGDVFRLCAERDGELVGHVVLEDLPSLGQEASDSPDQVQATLAVRIHTLYQSLQAERLQRCGPDYEITTDRPEPVTVAGQNGLKYGLEARLDGEVVERTVGYRTFRKPIETIIEATAIAPGGCVPPLETGFTVEQLQEFEPVLDRIVAGSDLPPALVFESTPADQPGSSADPRKARIPSAGLGVEHRLD